MQYGVIKWIKWRLCCVFLSGMKSWVVWSPEWYEILSGMKSWVVCVFCSTVAALLDAKDLFTYSVPDRKCIILYVSQVFLTHFAIFFLVELPGGSIEKVKKKRFSKKRNNSVARRSRICLHRMNQISRVCACLCGVIRNVWKRGKPVPEQQTSQTRRCRNGMQSGRTSLLTISKCDFSNLIWPHFPLSLCLQLHRQFQGKIPGKNRATLHSDYCVYTIRGRNSLIYRDFNTFWIRRNREIFPGSLSSSKNQ